MKITTQELIDGLATLDPAVDAHWTEEGAPALQAVIDATFDDTITRQDINDNANGFTREIAAETLAGMNQEQADAVAALQDAPDLPEVAAVAAVNEIDSEAEANSKQALDAAVLGAKQALEDHDAAVAKAKLKRDGLVAALDKATRVRDQAYPPLKPAEAIQQWIANEAEKRRIRAETVIQIRAPKSALDASMERRSGHGFGRKTRALGATG